MNLQYAERAYRSTMVNTTESPLDLIIMLYEGAIEFLERAVDAVKMGNRAEKARLICRVISIVEELLKSLDHNVGGEVSTNLQSLYIYMLRELTHANVSDDLSRIQHIIELFKILLDAWRQIR